jgi:ketosteroid isomerase-like protein
MSRENVETFKRGLAAYNRRDADALLEMLDDEVEWYPALLVKLGGEATVYRGHAGVRAMLLDTDDTLAEINAEFSDEDIRDLGEQLVAIGTVRTRGKSSGVVTESPVGYLAEFRDGKATRIDPREALEAAGLRE